MNTIPYSSATLRLGIAALAGMSLGAVASAPAHAHDTLIASTPEADQVLEASPDEVVLEFFGEGLTTGDAITNEILVLGPEEEDWASEEPAEVEGSTMRTDIPEPLPNGEYEIRYRVVYSDGHSEELGFSFEVDAPLTEGDDDAALGEPEEAEAPEDPTETADAGTAAAEPAPTEQVDDDAALSGAETEDESGQWGGPFWVALASALAGVAAVAWFTARRRGRTAREG
ncbi:copper resistance CopC family protein [Nesterenkonia natronophila]|uniref:Copper resistance protein CopC n=1 Tax=Nesterenkonia natronophila TaxID=2174932 RepID=A0A3A4F0Y8_9MICC|nr:copper resistance CopC family protein [Nesterenkonia natronophila]RJN31743.1 copper resistance protein CopC [Nesterenkonia natronophila]